MNQPSSSLAARCEAYLKQGPPPQMTNYVPGSILEIILAHGAKSQPIDAELRELAGLVLEESQDAADRQDAAAVRAYLQQGATLVKEVLEA